MYRGEYHNAHAITHILQSYPRLHNTTNQSVEVQIQSMQCLALNYIYAKSWDKAIPLTKKLCTISKEAGLHPYHAKFLLQLASIYIESTPKNALVSLPIVLESVNLCQQYAMDSLHAYSLFILAKIHLLSNNAKKSLILLKGCMSTIVQHSSIQIQGDVYLTLSKCYMSNASSSDTKKKIVKLCTTSLSHIQKAIQLFQKIQDLRHLRECYYLQARIYHSLSSTNNIYISKRNVAANKFQEADMLLKQNGNMKTAYDVLLPLVDSEFLKKLSLR